MEISIKLDKDFERTLDHLRDKYGEDFEFLNGVHPSQLDYSEFINNLSVIAHEELTCETNIKVVETI